MAQRSSLGLAASRIRASRVGRFPRGGLLADRPHHLAVAIGSWPLELAADVMTVPRDGTLEPEERPAVPTRAGDGLGDHGERTVLRPVPGEPFIEHHHLMGDFLPCAD